MPAGHVDTHVDPYKYLPPVHDVHVVDEDEQVAHEEEAEQARQDEPET